MTPRPVRVGRVALIAAVVIAGLAGERAFAQSPTRPPLRWGGDAEGGAPFVEADPADPSRVRGFDVDVAEMIARGLGRPPRFVQVAWASIEQSVERGDFDMGLSGVEDRPELRERHAVTVPYFEFREVLAVRAADRDRYRTLADLAGRKVATLGSTLAYRILLDAQATSKLIPVSYDDDVHPYSDLVDGRVDAVLLDHIIAERSLRRLGGFVIQPQPAATGHYVVVLAKVNAALRDFVDGKWQVVTSRTRDASCRRARVVAGDAGRPGSGFFISKAHLPPLRTLAEPGAV